MALSLALSYCVSNGCKTLTLQDETGNYNVTNNPTGWGSPNDTLATVEAATLLIKDPSGNDHDIDIVSDLAITFDGSTVVEDLVYPVTNKLLGYDTSDYVPDGTWEVVYSITSDGNDYSVTRRFFTVCRMEKRIDELLKKYADLVLTGRQDYRYLDSLYDAFLLFVSLKKAVVCGATVEAETIYARVNKMLNLIDYDYVNL